MANTETLVAYSYQIKAFDRFYRLQKHYVFESPMKNYDIDLTTIEPLQKTIPVLDYIKKNSFIIIENGSRPLSKTLSRVKLHITENSSVVHEASDFGVKSLFWCRQQAPLIFNEEVENKMAKLWDLRQDEKKLTLELVSFIK
jgi:hypothetical protein